MTTRFSPKRDATIKLLKAGKSRADVLRMAGVSKAYYSKLKGELEYGIADSEPPSTLQDRLSGVTDMARRSSSAVWRVIEVTLSGPNNQVVTLSGKPVSLNLLKTLLRP